MFIRLPIYPEIALERNNKVYSLMDTICITTGKRKRKIFGSGL
jgi:hypothetical protein